jgi:glycosyltransferase 2 family protein
MKHRVRALALSVLAIALLAWSFRHANLADVWRQIRQMDAISIVVAVGLLAVQMAIRAIRWQYLLEPVGRAHFQNTFRTTVIGFAASNVLPARAGEVLRPYLLARREGFSAAAAFATVIMERVTDMMAVLVLLAVFVFGTGLGHYSGAMQRIVQLSAGIAVVAVVVLLGVSWTLASHPERIGRFVLRADRVLPSRIAHALSKLVRTFSEGLLVMRRPRAFALALAWSLLLWIMISAQTWLVTSAFGIAMPFTGSFLLQSLLVIGVAVPTPGGVGGFHEAYRIGATTFFGAANDAAIGAAIVLHGIAFVPITLVGIWFAMRDGLSLTRLESLTETARREEVPVAP